MAKKSDVRCPLCSWKGDPGGKQFPPHADESGAACVMSTRTVPQREDDGPVTDGATASGATGDTTPPSAL
jgi:hypothetical protein